MSDRSSAQKQFSISRDPRISARAPLPSLATFVSAIAILFLVYAFFSGLSYQFYASFVFLFYSVTKSMWTSVVLLGVFQTLLMIPFRVVRLILSNNIKEFQRNVEQMQDRGKQGFTLRQGFRQGNSTFLFYSVDFVAQFVSFVSIGRLFLTDFYRDNLDPSVLYSWVQYPQYPIRDTFFKIPYPVTTGTTDLGWNAVIIVWIILIVIQIAILAARRVSRSHQAQQDPKEKISEGWTRYSTGYLLAFMLIAYWIVRSFPTGFDMRIFSGDVSLPNRQFNTVTAVATFITLLWHGIPKVLRKGRMAEYLGIPTTIIEKTQREMFRETIFSAALVGLGAYFITNQIPSAFELSIFTLEVISLVSPFTLDKLVFKSMPVESDDDDTEDDVLHQFGQESRPKEAEELAPTLEEKAEPPKAG